MTIYDKNGDAFLEITPDDTSYRHREVMGDDTLVLKFSLAVHAEIPVGATCSFGGETYTLARPEALTMRHSRDFEYTVTMEGSQYRAEMWKMRDLTDGRVKFSLTAKPSEHLQLLIDNLNDREGAEVWSAGGCIDGVEVCISYDHVYCREALDLMAEAFGTEWEIDGAEHTVSLGKVEHDRDNPISLSYGKGNGFLPDVGRSNSSDSPPCEVLYAQGGSDNIDASKYPQELHRDDEQNPNSSVLLLPPGRRIGYDGEKFHYEGDEGWDGNKVRHYVVDEKGYYIRRDPDEKEPDTTAEDSLDCSDIYPKRVGTVAAVYEVENADGDVPFYDFTDTDPDDDPCPDYSGLLIAGETMTVIFQSGNLAGREFDVNYVHDAEDGKEARRFEVVQQEVDGVVMPQGPGEAFGINPGDTYAVFGCMLPDEYLCNDAGHSGAEWDMLRQCAAYMYEHEQENPTITGKVDAIWARGRWADIGDRVRPGGYVHFWDDHWQREVLLIRITGVKDYLNSPYSPELELSNETKGTGLFVVLMKTQGDVSAANETIGNVKAGAARRVSAAKLDLEASISRVKDDLTASIGKIEDGFNTSIGKIEDDFNTSIGKIEDDFNTSIGKIEDEIAGVNDNLTVMGETLSSLKGSVSTLEGEMADIDGYVGSIVDAAVTEAKGELEAYTDSAVKGATEKLEGSIGTLVDSAVSTVKEEIEGDMTAYTDSAVGKVSDDLTASISKVESDLTASISTVESGLTASISKVETDLNASISKVAEDATAYTDSAVSKVSDDLKDSITKVESDLTDSISAVSDKADAVASDLKDVQGTVTTVEGEVSAIDGRLTLVEGSIAEVSNELGAAQGKIADVTDAVTALEGTVTDLEAGISAVSDKANSIASDLKDVQGSIVSAVDLLEGEISDVRTAVDAEISGVGSWLDSLYGTVEGITDSLNGTDDTAGIIAVVGLLQEAVTKLNAGLKAVDAAFSGVDVGGSVTPVDPNTGTSATLTVNVDIMGGDAADAIIAVEIDGVVYSSPGPTASYDLTVGTSVKVTVTADGCDGYSDTIRVTGDMTIEVTLYGDLFTFVYNYDGTNPPTLETSDTPSDTEESLFVTGGPCEVSVNGTRVTAEAGASLDLGPYMRIGENTVRVSPLLGSLGSSHRTYAGQTYRRHITEVVSWGSAQWGDCTFLLYGATSLRSVAPLGAGFAETADFTDAFGYCSGLTSLPEGLFAGCAAATRFSYCFEGCEGLTSLPEGLFDNCPSVTTFQSCFDGCSGLTSLPEGLFDNCPSVTTFHSCFDGCEGLTSLPEGLFAGCAAATRFSYCFEGCEGLTGESAYDLVDIGGVATMIHLYERGDHPDLYDAPESTTRCYRYCEGLDDYDAIPNGWK